MTKMPFVEFVRETAKISARIQLADAEELDRSLPAWLERTEKRDRVPSLTFA